MLRLRVTFMLKPFSGLKVIVVVPVEPVSIVRLWGPVASMKS